MALNGEGEPTPTLVQVATQAVTIELFTQWQTYRNGVHMDWDTFRSIDFRAIALAVLTGAGFEVTTDDVTDMPKLRKLPTRSNPFSATDTAAYDALMARNDPAEVGRSLRVDEDPLGRTVTDGKTPSRPYGLTAEQVAEHGEQVQG